MTDNDEVLRYLHEAKARVEGGGVSPPVGSDAVRYTRDRLEEALPYAHAGGELPANVRLKPVKQVVLGAVRPVTSNQAPFNRAVLQALDGAAAALEGLAHSVDISEHHLNRAQAALATTELTLDELVEEVRSVRSDLDALTVQVDEVRSLAAGAASEAAVVRGQLDLVLRTAREALAGQGITVDQLSLISRELTSGHEQLYQDLEDTFRGTADEVKAKLSAYLDDVRAAAGDGGGAVIDVGCGRGEWLELLAGAGIEAYGVDTNQVVVDRCQARGLDVRLGDALTHLREVPEGSVSVITSFHVVEHLSLDTLVGLVDAALVALAPGGLLVFETPNPTNVNVGAASFYLDPTHLKPLHPQFLEFLVAQRGFELVEVRYLNPVEGPALSPDDLVPGEDLQATEQVVDRINWALAGPLDYGVLARKAPAAGR